MKNRKKMYKILSCDGGGIKGLIQAYILNALEREMGKKCCEIFDGMAGSSVGSINSGLLSIKKSAQECIDFFEQDAPQIFKGGWWNPSGLFRPKYSGKVIESYLQNALGQVSLKDVSNKLLITSVDISGKKKPFFFKSYDNTNSYKIWQACRASSAAETYFDLYSLDNMILTDGGNCANNPSLNIYSDYSKIYKIPDNQIKILSLGCGDYESKEDYSDYINCGALKILTMVVNLILTSSSEDVDYEMENILGDNYMRIQPILSQDVPLDGTSPQNFQTLKNAAQDIIDNQLDKIIEFLQD